jgi:4-amino-4-deoxy-L-arabinose transferase-like glycosyltransferase
MDTIKIYFRDIRFWIILFFFIRLIGITNPPLEIGHNWRQTTVTMVSRNFLETDNNIFYPRIDIAGNKTGITGMEFPLFNYLTYLVSEIFGYQHWYGRLINLIISSLGLFFFYKLIEKYFMRNIAFSSTLILLFSIWFTYSRKIMPDTFAMSFILAGIYFGTNYFDKNSRSGGFLNLIYYGVLIALGTLSKLPSAYLLIIFLIPILSIEVIFKRKIAFVAASIFSLLPSIIWYFYWVPYLVETYGFLHFFLGKELYQGIIEITNNINSALQNFYENAFNFIGFALFLFGLVHVIIKKKQTTILCFCPEFLIHDGDYF